VGALNNLLFGAIGAGLTILQFVVVTRLAGPEEIGLFTIAAAFGIMVENIADFGFGDRIIQGAPERLQESYDLAVTLHLILAVALCLVVIASAPIVAGVYGQPVLSGLIVGISYSAFAGVLRLPLALFTRDLRYFEYRLLLLIGKIAGFVVTVVLAWRGSGAWSLVIGGLTGTLAMATPAWYWAPLRPRWRIEVRDIPSLMSFSWPLWTAKLIMIVVQQGAILLISAFLSVRDVGAFKFAEQVATFVLSVDVVLAATLFPALCKVQSPEGLGSAFSKPSRISLIWASGMSVAMILFAEDCVRLLLTPEWSAAVLFLRAQGAAALLGAIGYSWDSAFKAAGRTLPILGMAFILATSLALLFAPALVLGGRVGAALGLVLMGAATLCAKHYYLSSLRAEISLFQISKRAVTAGIAALLVVTVLGVAVQSESLGVLVLRIVVFGVVYGTALLYLEGTLLREVYLLVAGAVRRRQPDLLVHQDR
jgi:O-antigen/teichoic acid export membrane protein